MSTAQLEPCLKLSDESLSDVRRARDLLVGGGALLQRADYIGGPNDDGDALRELITEAKATLDGVIERLEAFFAWQHEQDQQAHVNNVAQSLKHIAPVVVR